MARGNDPDAAKDLQEKYGTPGNAEALINANRARRNRAVASASRQPIDAEATKKLKLSEVKLADDEDGTVVDATVRGKYVSYVWEDALGRLHHGAQLRKGLSKSEKEQAEADAGEPTATEEAASAHAAQQAELDKIRADYDRRLAEAVAKAREDASAEAQKQADQATK